MLRRWFVAHDGRILPGDVSADYCPLVASIATNLLLLVDATLFWSGVVENADTISLVTFSGTTTIFPSLRTTYVGYLACPLHWQYRDVCVRDSLAQLPVPAMPKAACTSAFIVARELKLPSSTSSTTSIRVRLRVGVGGFKFSCFQYSRPVEYNAHWHRP